VARRDQNARQYDPRWERQWNSISSTWIFRINASDNNNVKYISTTKKREKKGKVHTVVNRVFAFVASFAEWPKSWCKLLMWLFTTIFLLNVGIEGEVVGAREIYQWEESRITNSKKN
jgi:hypothetical protein